MRFAPVIAMLAFATASCSATSTTSTPVNDKAASTSANPATSSVTQVTQPAMTTSPAAAKAHVGSTIAINGQHAGNVLEVTLVKIVDPAKPDNDFTTPAPGKRFVVLQFKLVNKGAAEYDDDPMTDVKVKDAAGQSYDPELVGVASAGQPIDTGLKLPPGDTALGTLTFALPSGSKVAKVQYTLSAGFGNTGQWSVG